MGLSIRGLDIIIRKTRTREQKKKNRAIIEREKRRARARRIPQLLGGSKLRTKVRVGVNRFSKWWL